MPDPHLAILVLTTCPSREEATQLARALVEGSFCACVNILPSVQSIYRWEERIHQDEECLLLIKTTREAYAGVEENIRALHSYQVPEILAVESAAISDAYRAWLVGQIEPARGQG